jgi:hypothetical protein
MRPFTIRRVATLSVAVAVVGAWCATGQGQNVPGYWAGDVSLAPSAEDNLNRPTSSEVPPVALSRIAPEAQRASGADSAIPSQTRQALDFYGGRSARATLNGLPRNTAYQSTQAAAPQSTRRPAKPFQNAANRPAISPYLNLFRDDKGSHGIPNYYMFVQPQLEQQAAAERGQIQFQRRERQGQTAASSAAGAQHGFAAQSGSDMPAHFMDTAQFYSGWRR